MPLPSQLKAKLPALELAAAEVVALELDDVEFVALEFAALELDPLEFSALAVEVTVPELEDGAELAASELATTEAEELAELFRLLALDALEGTVAGADDVAPPDEPPPQADITLAITNVKKTFEKFMLMISGYF